MCFTLSTCLVGIDGTGFGCVISDGDYLGWLTGAAGTPFFIVFVVMLPLCCDLA